MSLPNSAFEYEHILFKNKQIAFNLPLKPQALILVYLLQ